MVRFRILLAATALLSSTACGPGTTFDRYAWYELPNDTEVEAFAFASCLSVYETAGSPEMEDCRHYARNASRYCPDDVWESCRIGDRVSRVEVRGILPQ